MSKTVAIIPARGGSKGIPRKNVIDLCGRPLIAWSIRQALAAKHIDSVWVTSEDEEILRVARSNGAHAIKRPDNISGDTASSESAWLHALDHIEASSDIDGGPVDWIVGMQATSPLRSADDLDAGLALLHDKGYDSLLSVTEVEDFFTWRQNANGEAESVNYNFTNRKRRQQIEIRYLENGSYYVFRPETLRTDNNRLGGHVGMYVMDRHKMFQIDNPCDIALCEAIMRGYGLDKA